MEELSGRRLDDLLELMSGARAAPAAGTAASWSLGAAAALLGKTARLSHRQLADWHDHAATADELRRAALALGEDDAEAVTAMVKAAKRGSNPVDQGAETPQEILELAGQVRDLASMLARDGNRWLYADAEAARLLAESSIEIAQTLIRVNDEKPTK